MSNIELLSGKLNMSFDGQFGSTGKGLLNSVLGKFNAPEICITNAAPNAGHTYDLNDGKGKQTVFHLPVAGVMNKDSVIYLCAGSIIDPEILAKELVDFEVDPARVFIHPRACVLLPEHGQREKDKNSGATSLSSTQKGVGAALADKVSRAKGPRTMQQYVGDGVRWDNRLGHISNLDLVKSLREGECALMEVPQGFGLSINHGLAYPYCTSRDITVASALNDVGLHPSFLGRTYMSLRTFPIRVGNIKDEKGIEIGYSGPFYEDSRELTWEELNQQPELTTVTKRVRRVATFSSKQYRDALIMNRPDVVFMNFWNYFEEQDEKGKNELFHKMALAEKEAKCRPVRTYGNGHTVDDVVGPFTYRADAIGTIKGRTANNG